MDRLSTIEDNQRQLLTLRDNHQNIGSNSKKSFKNMEYKIYSQNGEDGLLHFIFSKIGTTNRCFVEFGISSGIECNTANLSINHGWNGLLIDGDVNNIKRAKYYYNQLHKIEPEQIKIVSNFITAQNIDKIISENCINGKIDLLSIDIDGNDYWVWKAIKSILPRVVVIEYNASLGSEKSVTVNYDPQFDVQKKHKSGWYHGASLAALTKLGNSNGYMLIGCDSTGTNAFYVLKDIAHDNLNEVSVREAFYPDSRRLGKFSSEEQYELIKYLDWIEI